MIQSQKKLNMKLINHQIGMGLLTKAAPLQHGQYRNCKHCTRIHDHFPCRFKVVEQLGHNTRCRHDHAVVNTEDLSQLSRVLSRRQSYNKNFTVELWSAVRFRRLQS